MGSQAASSACVSPSALCPVGLSDTCVAAWPRQVEACPWELVEDGEKASYSLPFVESVIINTRLP